ncbi:FAD-binding protein [Streptomyces sp. LHD-70]|uniref:FAD-binding protein n=1 Tax=Streptomyces sp. LHD-70 TaxID=3072140 RepID=UPI00281063A8|nr:FAD-binding protein [Streptomyces sp. LHD-70]MDQ8706910.1 FAD-binding protein [Streptomyces sp. LHD-70]
MTNWAGNIDLGRAEPARPESVDALRRTVAGSAHVRALGARHSFSGILATAGTFVQLDRLPQTVDIDPDAGTATVTAGMRYTDVAAALHRSGRALANLASLPDITVAGACATGTHGSGDTLQGLAAAVVGLQLVGPEGDLTELSRDGDHDTFAGSVVALGALGVVTRLTLRTEPAYQMAQTVRVGVALDAVRDRFDSVFGAAHSVSVFTRWDGDAAVWLKRRTDRPAPGLTLGTPAEGPLNPVPGADPAPCTDQSGTPGPWHERLPHIRPGTTPRSGDELQSEYFLPRTAATAAITRLCALGALIAPALKVGEIRTVRADDLWLSPAYAQDSVAFHFTWTRNTARVWPAVAAVEEALAPLGARPHWAKLTTLTGPGLRSRYLRAPDFRELRAKHDPDGKFAHPVVDALTQDRPGPGTPGSHGSPHPQEVPAWSGEF